MTPTRLFSTMESLHHEGYQIPYIGSHRGISGSDTSLAKRTSLRIARATTSIVSGHGKLWCDQQHQMTIRLEAIILGERPDEISERVSPIDLKDTNIAALIQP